MEITTACPKCNKEIKKNIFSPGMLQIINIDKLEEIEWYCEACENRFFVDRVDNCANIKEI